MNNSESNIQWNRYLNSIILSVQMEGKVFFKKLLNGKIYEKNIYTWSLEFFENNVPIDKAIKGVDLCRKIVAL